LGRAGQWSLRLPCAAQGWHASWGRRSSEGLGVTVFGKQVEVRSGFELSLVDAQPAERSEGLILTGFDGLMLSEHDFEFNEVTDALNLARCTRVLPIR
jgi:hypothetical protein